MAWAAGVDSFAGTWPVRWHPDVNSPSARAFVQAFTARHGKPPEDQAAAEYFTLKLLVQSMNEIKSTDSEKLIAHLEKEPQFDVLKGRKGYFRAWDHQLIQEMYTMTPKAKGRATNKWDFMQLSAPLPGPSARLDSLAPTREENDCKLA
jgi:branched-chain amino acid transport system substrate-binding protein